MKKYIHIYFLLNENFHHIQKELIAYLKRVIDKTYDCVVPVSIILVSEVVPTF